VVAPKPEPPFPKSQAAPLGVLCSCIDISAWRFDNRTVKCCNYRANLCRIYRAKVTSVIDNDEGGILLNHSRKMLENCVIFTSRSTIQRSIPSIWTW
jgi:hypothetical protein